MKIESVLLVLILAGLSGCASPPSSNGSTNVRVDACAAASEQDIAALFDRWNSSLQRGDLLAVSANDAGSSILLAMLSNTPRITVAEKEDYFSHLLENKPVGSIDQAALGIDVSDAMLVEARPACEMPQHRVHAQQRRQSYRDRRYQRRFRLQQHPVAACAAEEPAPAYRSVPLGVGGVPVFRVPPRANPRNVNEMLHVLPGNRLLNMARRLRYGRRGVMEMHAMVKDEMLRLLVDGGMTLVEAERSDASGTPFVGYCYFAVKR